MLSIGNSKVSKLYLGDTECKKAYLGDTLVFGKESSSVLPDGYTQVEYIRFNGIKTSFALQENINCNTDKISYKFYPENYNTSTTGNRYFFIINSDIGSKTFYLSFISYNYEYIKYYLNDDGYATMKSIKLSHLNKLLEFNIDFLNNKYTVNNETLSGTKNLNSLGKFSKIIGCSNLSSKVNSCEGKYYYFTHYRNGEIIHNYLPCVNPNGIVGIFDTNSQTFIQNTNPVATAITAGPAV